MKPSADGVRLPTLEERAELEKDEAAKAALLIVGSAVELKESSDLIVVTERDLHAGHYL